MRSRIACFAIIALAVAALSVRLANAGTVPLFFSGPQQSLNVGVTLDPASTFQVSGTLLGGAATIPNQTIPVTANSVMVGTNPISEDHFGTGNLAGVDLNQLTDIEQVDLDALNGQTPHLSANTLVISAIVGGSPETIDVGPINATVTGLSFTQTASAVLTGGSTVVGGNGTFSIPGNVSADLHFVPIPVVISGSTLTTVTIATTVIPTPFTLTGNWTVTPDGIDQRLIQLDGSQNLSLPANLVTQLVSAGLSATVNVALMASVDLAFNYHLQTVVTVVPEPGSIVLLGIGLAALVPLIRRRRKVRK